MDPKQIHERLLDATARLETVVLIAGMLGDGERAADPLQELLEEDADSFARCFPDAPQWLHDALDDGGDMAGAFNEWAVATGKLGFAIKVATPVMEHYTTGSDYSWGLYRTAWVYGDTLDAAIDAGLAWVQEQRDREMADARQKAAAV